MAKRDEVTVLEELVDRQRRLLDRVVARNEEIDERVASAIEEGERADAWLKHRWRDLWDETTKSFVVPSTGWPPEHVRVPKPAPQAEAPRADEPEPDTLMHRMMKEAQPRRS